MYAALHGGGNLRALAFEFSPVVEAVSDDTVVLDAGGLDRLFGLPQEVAAAMAKRAAETGVKANLALASTPDAAVYAARGFAGVSVIPHGDEAKYLGPLPLSLLAPSPELQETLERWGIRRFQDLAALPPLGIAERLGPEGLRLHQQARGGWNRKLVPLEEPPRFDDELELEYPVELLEPLAFLLARLLNGLCTRLATRGLATDELRLRLKLEDRTEFARTLRLPVPALDTKAFLKLMQLDLGAHPPPAPVVHVRLEVNPVKPQAAQHGLFVPRAPEPVKLELTIARIEALVGAGHIGSPELIDTHRPGAFRMTRFGMTKSGAPKPPARAPASPAAPERIHVPSRIPLDDARGSASLVLSRDREGAAGRFRAGQHTRLALRVFRPPRAARVTVEDGQPSHVLAEGVRGRILSLAGPWRTSGDWWTAEPWARDEWDVALSDGALYRICCSQRGWFVEGSYD